MLADLQTIYYDCSNDYIKNLYYLRLWKLDMQLRVEEMKRGMLT